MSGEGSLRYSEPQLIDGERVIVALTSDGSPAHTVLTVNGLPVSCKSIEIPKVTVDSGPLTVVAEIYLDRLRVAFPGRVILQRDESVVDSEESKVV